MLVSLTLCGYLQAKMHIDQHIFTLIRR